MIDNKAAYSDGARKQDSKQKFDSGGRPFPSSYLVVTYEGPECLCVLPRAYNWSGGDWCNKRHDPVWTVSMDGAVLRVFDNAKEKDTFLDSRDVGLAEVK